MNGHTDQQLHNLLDAWGMAETHTVSKQLKLPPPAFTNAVQAQGAISRLRFRLLIGLLAIILLFAVAAQLIRHSTAPAPAVQGEDIQHSIYMMQREILQSDRPD